MLLPTNDISPLPTTFPPKEIITIAPQNKFATTLVEHVQQPLLALSALAV